MNYVEVWPQGEFPLLPVGKLVLNRNPQNYFAEVEQIAFSPAHLVPGIEPRYVYSPTHLVPGLEPWYVYSPIHLVPGREPRYVYSPTHLVPGIELRYV